MNDDAYSYTAPDGSIADALRGRFPLMLVRTWVTS